MLATILLAIVGIICLIICYKMTDSIFATIVYGIYIVLIIIIFQPEIRRALEQLGGNNRFSRFFGFDKDIITKTKEDIYKIEPFAIRSFWKDKEYIMEDMSLNDDYSNLFELLNPSSLYNTDVKDNVKRLLKRRDIYFK